MSEQGVTKAEVEANRQAIQAAALLPEPPVTADHTPERLSAEERTLLVEALRYDRCEYGCAVTYTEEAVRYDLAPAVERILAAHLADVEARLAAVEAVLNEPGGWRDRRAGSEQSAMSVFAALHPDPSEGT